MLTEATDKLPGMLRSSLKLIAVLSTLAIIASACSSSGEVAASSTTAAPTTTTTAAPTTTTTAPPTTTSPSTTTTTIPTEHVSEAINGLPADDAQINRRVVAIKIDNHVKARPQIGLNEADAVYEALVEGGITRFIALYQRNDLDKVGPNRSGRVTDSALMKPLGGAFQISGAQGWVKDVFRADGINVIYDNGVTTFRDNSRPRPHNLFTSTDEIRAWADKKGWEDENPGNLFLFGDEVESEAKATNIAMSFSDAPPARWEWDGEVYLRSNGNDPHETYTSDGELVRVTADVLVALKVREYIARNPAGSGTVLPTADTVGSGEGFVFYNGGVTGVTWERGSKSDRFSLIAQDGTELVLPPGRLWMSLIPNTKTVSWE